LNRGAGRSRAANGGFAPDQAVPLLPTALCSGLMSPAERLDEVARLLALGFLRLHARRQREKAKDPNQLRNFGLDFGGEGSVCDTDAHADRERA
jgi:hypothetical protein